MSAFSHIPGLHSANTTPLGPPPNGTSYSSDDPTLSLDRLLAEARPTPPGIIFDRIPQPHQSQQMHEQVIHQELPPSPAQPTAHMQGIKQENGIHTPPVDNDDFEVPQCLLYGQENGEDDHVIPGRRLSKLPKDVLINLLKEGERMGSIHRLGATPNWESLQRLNQYLDCGDYTPFKPHVLLEYLDGSGTAHEWAARDSPNAVEVPRATYELFLREIDLYLFAAKIGYTELRRTSAERICTRYPKSVHSIWALIDKVATIAAQNQDQGMMQRIVSYVNSNCKELTGLPEYLPLLRKLTRGRPPLGPVLLEAYISSSEAARRELKLGLKVVGSADGVTPKTQGAPPPIVAPTGPAAAGPSSSFPSTTFTPARRHQHPTFNAPFPAHELPNLVEALQRQCLVVANDNGYGTLVKDGRRNVRNTEFKFLKGEILAADRYADTVNGRHNVLVMNSRGEIGDILRTLVKKVPPGLGVLSPDASVNAGGPPSANVNDFKPDFKNGHGHGRVPDREQRTFFPAGGHHRSRSRSPMRRY